MTSALASEATLRALEFPSLQRILAELTATDLGRAGALALEPAEDAAQLEGRRSRLVEGERLLLDGALAPHLEEPLAPLLEQLRTGRPALDGRDLVRLADALRASRAAALRILSASPPCPALGADAAALPEARPLLERIERTLDRRGEVREDASPLLAQLRRDIRRHRDGLYKRLQAKLAELRAELAEETIPLRNGRLVLLLQAGALGRVKGLLHGRSATGKSFYFEPLDAVDANNALQQAIEDEEGERRRILVELYEAVREESSTLERHAAHLGALDLVQAKARFGERVGARLAELAPPGHLTLRGARHPLLDPRLRELRSSALGQAGHVGEVVPLDVELGGDSRVLVVTGPNAGGKTVALKTVGLLALMHQAGLPLPAGAGTQLPYLRRLVATVGDEQDLLADRSTFSGRLLRLKEAWEAAGPESLLLLDELGSGTDPEEGAALSAALLESLLERRALGVITTHLTKLAAAALELSGAACAAMEFESGHQEMGRPTFHLQPGPPGGSEAIALARRLGLPRAWLERAEAKLGPEQRDLRRMLGEVERARRELVEARAALAAESADLAKLRERAAAQEQALREERRGLSARLQTELDEFRRATQKKLRGEVERLERALASGRRKNLAAEAAASLFSEAPRFAPPSADEEAVGPLALGGEVRHRALGWRGRLEKLDGDRAEVQVGGKRLRCAVDELAGVAAAPAPTAPARRPRSGPDLDREAAVEINLIGQRVEPALETLDAFLDQALLSSRQQVRIIHGHGTGRLRDAVRLHLRKHPAVAAERPGEPNEGGNGATVVTLRRG